MGETRCSLFLLCSRAVGVSLAQQYLGEQGGAAKLFGETLFADSHEGRCGDGKGKPPSYPISL
jgi:hypothetical protein